MLKVHGVIVNKKKRCKASTYLLSCGALIKLDEGILQTISRLPIPDHLATKDLAEPREDQLEIFVLSYRVQLAHEQDVLGRSDSRKGDIADHLQGERCRRCGSLSAGELGLFLGYFL